MPTASALLTVRTATVVMTRYAAAMVRFAWTNASAALGHVRLTVAAVFGYGWIPMTGAASTMATISRYLA